MRRVMDGGKLLLVLDLDHTLLNSTRTAEVRRACDQAPSCTPVSRPSASCGGGYASRAVKRPGAASPARWHTLPLRCRWTRRRARGWGRCWRRRRRPASRPACTTCRTSTCGPSCGRACARSWRPRTRISSCTSTRTARPCMRAPWPPCSTRAAAYLPSASSRRRAAPAAADVASALHARLQRHKVSLLPRACTARGCPAPCRFSKILRASWSLSGQTGWPALAGVTEWGRRPQADSRQRHVKDLGVVLGAEAAVIIVDDTAGVWPQHAANLLTVWPRSRTPCACPWHETPCRQRGSLLPSSPHSAKLGTITCPCSDAAEAVSATRHASEPRRG